MTSTSCITTKEKSSRELVQDALDANKKLQRILTQRAEQLEADLKEADNLLVSVRILWNTIPSNIDSQDRMLQLQILGTIHSRRL